jgi:hypothetical protein
MTMHADNLAKLIAKLRRALSFPQLIKREFNSFNWQALDLYLTASLIACIPCSLRL